MKINSYILRFVRVTENCQTSVVAIYVLSKQDLAIVVASVWLVEHEMQEAETVHRCLRLGLS